MDALSRLPLRGREQELAVIRRRLSQVRAGTGCVVVVEGSAGLGKTRLLDECASMAGQLSFRVGRGAAEPGRPIELGALFDALFEGDPPLADRRALNDVHASPEFLFWLLQDVQSLIEEAALQNPVLICLDDLHWGGTSLSLAMRQLPLRLSSLPVAWVMAFRPDQGPVQVQQAKAELIESGAELIRLGPLNREAVAQVAADVLGVEADGELLQKADRVQGNPFLLVEFFRGLQDDHLVSLDSGRATLAADRLPRRVGDSMRGRLGRLSPASERAATFASGLGRRFSIHDLAAMTEMPLTELIGPVSELVQADIFADDGGHLAFRHDIVREAVRGSLLPPVRRAVDRQAAQVLLARGALPAEVATQLVESAEPGDAIAIETALKATQALGASDPAAAAELAAKALDLTPLRHALRGPLVAQRVVSLFAAGLAEEGKRFADSALRKAMPVEEEARVRLSVAGMFDLSPEVRAESARAGLALASLPADLRAELWAALYHSLSVAGRKQEALDIEPSAREAAYASTSEMCRFAFEVPESGLAYQLLDFGRALEILSTAERRQLDGQGDPRARLAHLLRAWVLAATDRYDDALEAVDAGVIAAQRDRQNWALRVFETTRGRQMLQMGNFAEAALALEGRFSRGEAHLVAGALHAPSVVALGALKIHTGDKSGALEVAEIAKIMLQARAPGVRHHAMWYLALLALSQGDPMRSHGWLCSHGYEERLSMFPLYPHEVAYDAERVRIAAAVGDEELAEHAISIAERRASLNPDVPSCAAAAAHARGIWSDSAEDLGHAVSLYRGGPRPLAHASALEDLGRVLAQHGGNAPAIAALDEALTISARAGASWDAARVRGRLRRLGVRRRTVKIDRPKTGWEALTEAEAVVANLAARGCTNREIADKLFISPHTVNSHVRHVFEKLG
ncbi:MAG TPA: AAA family ATPase, partial [Solirubrobacteraceae bacterium]|nr:AAA family ATPase [Solirubrobacteraceae bacterium]